MLGSLIHLISIILTSRFLSMNKLLERNLQESIQSLNQTQMINVLEHYEGLTGILTEKSIMKTGSHYKCCIEARSMNAKGFGRCDEQALHNASKNLFSDLINNTIDIEQIKESLRHKNKDQNRDKRANQSRMETENSFLIDDISMIQPRQSINHYNPHNDNKQIQPKCDCVFYEIHQYRQNQLKHLQARINLLTEQNTMLKKLLIKGRSDETPKHINKENNSLYCNI